MPTNQNRLFVSVRWLDGGIQKHIFSNSIWVFPKIRVPQHGWFMMENPIKMDDLGVPPFKETSICARVDSLPIYIGDKLIIPPLIIGNPFHGYIKPTKKRLIGFAVAINPFIQSCRNQDTPAAEPLVRRCSAEQVVEHVLGVLRTGAGFGCYPTQRYFLAENAWVFSEYNGCCVCCVCYTPEI